jgi:phosphoribosylamine---glycine ligase
MNILLLGSGGREHALAWKMQQSHHCDNLFVAPGNPGTATCAINVLLNIYDFENIKDFIVANNVKLLVVGPEEPLVNGCKYGFLVTDRRSQGEAVQPTEYSYYDSSTSPWGWRNWRSGDRH